jgi:hypothetical protein
MEVERQSLFTESLHFSQALSTPVQPHGIFGIPVELKGRETTVKCHVCITMKQVACLDPDIPKFDATLIVIFVEHVGEI